MPGFGAGLGKILRFFQSGPRGRVKSGLLVSWDDRRPRPRHLSFARSLISPRKLAPLKTTSQAIDVPEIWSKNPTVQRGCRPFRSQFPWWFWFFGLVSPPPPAPLMTPATSKNGTTTSQNYFDIAAYLPKLAPAAKKAPAAVTQPARYRARSQKGPERRNSATRNFQTARKTAPHSSGYLITPTALLGNPALNVPNITTRKKWATRLRKFSARDSASQGNWHRNQQREWRWTGAG